MRTALGILAGILLGIIAPLCAQTTNDNDAVAVEAANAVEAEVATPEEIASGTNATARHHGAIQVGQGRRSRNHEPIVAFGRHVEVKTNETTEAVVVFGGTAKIEGKVTEAVVVIGGAAEISGEAGDAVAVGGSIRALPGAKIKGDAVAVAGSLTLEEGAQVKGDAVVVFGNQTLADSDAVEGQVVKVLAGDIPALKPLRDWFVECVLKLRPLAPTVGWVWIVYGAFFLLYALVALAFPRPVEICVQEITQRPITTFLMGLLTKVLIPVVFFILLCTGIGGIVVILLIPVLIIAGIVGKVALLQFLGHQVTRHFGGTQRPLLAFGVGWAIITVLYLVPVLGLLIFTVTGMWALGAAVMATFGGARREMPPRTSASQPTPGGEAASPGLGFAPMPMTPPSGASTLSVGGGAGAGTPATGAACEVASFTGQSTPTAGQATIPPVSGPPEALVYPRAGFWERFGAAFLDVILVSILGGMVGGPPWLFLVALAYFAGMWTWKGTTIGCVVLKLKVVRVDGSPMTFPVALVRGLAAAFSLVVFFLGFLWIAWDPEKQGWHDKIAGTVVVRLPRTQSLVCF